MTKVMVVLFGLVSALSLQAQIAISEDVLSGEWHIKKAEFRENTGEYSQPRISEYYPSQNEQANVAMPFRSAVTSLLVLIDHLNLTTDDMSLYDAAFEIRNMSTHQELVVEDNRIEEEEFRPKTAYVIEVFDDIMTLKEEVYFKDDAGRSVSGILITTLKRK